jgi:hypothetical protein
MIIPPLLLSLMWEPQQYLAESRPYELWALNWVTFSGLLDSNIFLGSLFSNSIYVLQIIFIIFLSTQHYFQQVELLPRTIFFGTFVLSCSFNYSSMYLAQIVHVIRVDPPVWCTLYILYIILYTIMGWFYFMWEHSVRQLATGRTTEGLEVESRWGRDFPLLHVIQTGSGAHPASYPMGSGRSFPGDNAAGEWIWPLTSNECRSLYIQFPIEFMA